jgi:hypothetical protein
VDRLARAARLSKRKSLAPARCRPCASDRGGARASIPAATAHPSVARWCGAKPRLLVVNRVDMVSERDRGAWAAHFAAVGERPLWTDGASGLGVGQARARFCRPPVARLPRALALRPKTSSLGGDAHVDLL